MKGSSSISDTEVSSPFDFFTSEDWVELNEHLVNKIKCLKSEIKSLKIKLNEVMHDRSLIDRNEELESELHASISENESLKHELDAHKEKFQRLENENKVVLEKNACLHNVNQELHKKIELTEKDLHDANETLSRFVSGHDNLQVMLGSKANLGK